MALEVVVDVVYVLGASFKREPEPQFKLSALSNQQVPEQVSGDKFYLTNLAASVYPVKPSYIWGIRHRSPVFTHNACVL